MNSKEIRQSFLDFFAKKGHRIVPSSSLLPTSPNLLFTNAGMNAFVPYFLGERTPKDLRVADTQKCIRAGGKHNDLEEVGFDTYHHTFFEMLGNWSFGDYFKKEAIEWAWELLTDVWKFPKERLYATVYQPADGEPATFDQEAYEIWTQVFSHAGLDPKTHLVYGHKKDNFWMMGDTGPCGPCSEIHMDLTPDGNSEGKLVNQGSPRCIEIWNLVFMQYNALPDGSLEPLKSHYVDTGMGLERVAGIFATTKNFTDFSSIPSNYDSDLFTPIFQILEEWTGHTYGGRVADLTHSFSPEEEKELEKDIAFRVIADHVRAATFAIADGIYPGNEGRSYTLRKMIRRAIYFGGKLGLGAKGPRKDPNTGHLRGKSPQETFFASLSTLVVHAMMDIFPELVDKAVLQTSVSKKIKIFDILAKEEDIFSITFEKGLSLFLKSIQDGNVMLSGKQAFLLHDTYGFPIEVTKLIAKEHHVSVDEKGFVEEMEKQKNRSKAAAKKVNIQVENLNTNSVETKFVGYELEESDGREKVFESIVFDVVQGKRKDGEEAIYLIVSESPFYGEKGGQVGDQGFICLGSDPRMPTLGLLFVCNTIWDGKILLHEIGKPDVQDANFHLDELNFDEIVKKYKGKKVRFEVDIMRRNNISRHHTATHLLQWALRNVLGEQVHQAGSEVTDHSLRFDFTYPEKLTEKQKEEVSWLCNRAIWQDAPVITEECSPEECPENCLSFFKDKYGDRVRMVSIGKWLKKDKEDKGKLLLCYQNPSQELCGGTHVQRTGELGQLQILRESSVSAGVRRIEACVGRDAFQHYVDLEKRCKALEEDLQKSKQAQGKEQQQASVADLKIRIQNSLKKMVKLPSGSEGSFSAYLSYEADFKSLRGVCTGILKEGKIEILGVACWKTILIFCSPKAIQSGKSAKCFLEKLTAECGGKGGGKEDFATGGVVDAKRLQEVWNRHYERCDFDF